MEVGRDSRQSELASFWELRSLAEMAIASLVSYSVLASTQAVGPPHAAAGLQQHVRVGGYCPTTVHSLHSTQDYTHYIHITQCSGAMISRATAHMDWFSSPTTLMI
jgi:hypothetical protein